jgi:hypothetical protein
MSTTVHIQKINNLLKAAYRMPNKAHKGVHKITELSQIPKLIDYIREHKYGPLLQIGSDSESIPTEFKAKFNKGTMRYAEQLVVLGRNYADYETIFDLIDSLKIGRAVADLTQAEKRAAELIEFTKKIRKEEYAQLDELISGTNLLFQDKREKDQAFNEIEREVNASRVRQSWILQGSLEQLYASVLPDAHHRDQRGLMNKIVVIWFLAEGFRYPLMLLYSMIVFHNIVNGYGMTKDGKVHREHYSKQAGSQAVQLMSFERYFDSTTDALSQQEKQEMKELDESFFQALKMMYDGMCRHWVQVELKELDLIEHQSAVSCFKECFRQYISLCGVEKMLSDTDLDSLVRDLNQMDAPAQEKFKTVDEVIKNLISVLKLKSFS